MNKKTALKKINDVFEVNSGDYHATKELDEGSVPLISCGEIDQGLVGYFDIPTDKTYQRCITVAYNGQPLTAKFHPYRFGAKDDIAVLIPRTPLKDTTLFYIAALLNRNKWRYSYGRKCFKEKLQNVSIPLPVVSGEGIDEDLISRTFNGATDFLEGFGKKMLNIFKK